HRCPGGGGDRRGGARGVSGPDAVRRQARPLRRGERSGEPSVVPGGREGGAQAAAAGDAGGDPRDEGALEDAAGAARAAAFGAAGRQRRVRADREDGREVIAGRGSGGWLPAVQARPAETLATAARAG